LPSNRAVIALTPYNLEFNCESQSLLSAVSLLAVHRDSSPSLVIKLQLGNAKTEAPRAWKRLTPDS
jgi:hypothetical protein